MQNCIQLYFNFPPEQCMLMMTHRYVKTGPGCLQEESGALNNFGALGAFVKCLCTVACM